MISGKTSLDKVACGGKVQIVSVDWDVLAPDEGKRLRALGLDEGAHIAVAHKGVFWTGDPLAILIGRMTIAIRKAHAAAMEVELL